MAVAKFKSFSNIPNIISQSGPICKGDYRLRVKNFNWETDEFGNYKYITQENWDSLDEGEWLNAPIGFIKMINVL